MPLTPHDRKFLNTIEHLKVLLLCMGVAVLMYVLCTPVSQMYAVTTVVGITLCALFWVTQRLLTLVTILDVELLKMIEAVKKALPEDRRRDLLGPGR